MLTRMGNVSNGIFPSFSAMRMAAPKTDDRAMPRRGKSVNDAFNRDRGGFAAADAECGDAAFCVLRLQRVQQRHDQAGAGSADRMTQRAGAAVDVELVSGNP